MEQQTHPAFKAWLQDWEGEIAWAQVLVRHRPPGYTVCHIEDRECCPAELKEWGLDGLYDLTRFSNGKFRPLLAAPDLERGWRFEATGLQKLERCLDIIYPGSIADWYAIKTGNVQPTDYRTYTNRQTGMYRLTQKLSDPLVAMTARSCCHKNFCLKRRLWTNPGLDPDPEAGKSLIPCLEPCPLLLELARKAMRLEQADKTGVGLAQEEITTLSELLDWALSQPDSKIRVADFSDPLNPRRLVLLKEKITAQGEGRI